MKNFLRVSLFVIIAFAANPLLAGTPEVKAQHELVVLSNNPAANGLNDRKENNRAKEHPVKNKINTLKKGTHDGGIVIGISSAALLVIIIVLLIILL